MKIEWGVCKGDDQVMYEVRYEILGHHVSAGLEQEEEFPEVDIYKIKLQSTGEVIPFEKWIKHGFTSQELAAVIEAIHEKSANERD